MAKYDKHYEEEQHFGEPYPDLIAFFKKHEPKGKVLDLGCGQGRDVIALARLGYDVTGVDISSVGIEQMLRDARQENLRVTGVVADIYDYHIDPHFDIVLLDSMLHFYKREREKETEFLSRIMDEMTTGMILCIFVGKSKTTEPILESIFKEESNSWNIIEDKYIQYPKMNSQYRMFIVEKF